MKELRSKFDEIQTKLCETRVENTNLKRSKEDIESLMNELKNQVEEKDKNIVILNDKIFVKESKLYESNSANDSLKFELENEKKKNETIEKQVRHLECELGAKDSQRKKELSELVSNYEEKIKLKDEEKNLSESEISRLNKEIDIYKERIDTKTAYLNTAIEQIREGKRAELESALTQIKYLKNENESIKSNIRDCVTIFCRGMEEILPKKLHEVDIKLTKKISIRDFVLRELLLHKDRYREENECLKLNLLDVSRKNIKILNEFVEVRKFIRNFSEKIISTSERFEKKTLHCTNENLRSIKSLEYKLNHIDVKNTATMSSESLKIALEEAQKSKQKEIDSLQLTLADLSDDVRRLEAMNNKKSEQLLRESEEKRRLLTELQDVEQLQYKMQELMKERQESLSRMNDASIKTNGLQCSNNLLNRELENLKNSTRNSIEEMTKELEINKNNTENVKCENSNLKLSIKTLQDSIFSQEDEIRIERLQKTKFQTELNEIRSKINQIISKFDSKMHELSGKPNNVPSITSELNIEEGLETLMSQFEILMSKSKDILSKNGIYKSELETLRSKIEELKISNSKFKKNLSQKESTIIEQQKELGELQNLNMMESSIMSSSVNEVETRRETTKSRSSTNEILESQRSDNLMLLNKLKSNKLRINELKNQISQNEVTIANLRRSKCNVEKNYNSVRKRVAELEEKLEMKSREFEKSKRNKSQCGEECEKKITILNQQLDEMCAKKEKQERHYEKLKVELANLKFESAGYKNGKSVSTELNGSSERLSESYKQQIEDTTEKRRILDLELDHLKSIAGSKGKLAAELDRSVASMNVERECLIKEIEKLRKLKSLK